MCTKFPKYLHKSKHCRCALSLQLFHFGLKNPHWCCLKYCVFFTRHWPFPIGHRTICTVFIWVWLKLSLRWINTSRHMFISGVLLPFSRFLSITFFVCQTLTYSYLLIWYASQRIQSIFMGVNISNVQVIANKLINNKKYWSNFDVGTYVTFNQYNIGIVPTLNKYNVGTQKNLCLKNFPIPSKYPLVHQKRGHSFDRLRGISCL